METIFIKNIEEHLDQEVCFQGWVRNYRKASSKLRFVIFRDGTGEISAVCFKPDMGEENFAEVKKLTMETSLRIIGTPKKHPKKEGVFELHVKSVEIVGESPEFPIGKKEHGADFLLSNRHLWIRSRRQWAALRIRHNVYYAVTEYLNNNDFIRFDSPILTPNACEGTTTLFQVPYFDLGSAFLSQSGQLYLEPAIMSFGRVYDFGPVFRAEKSKTRKHLTEFWMMDAEMAYMDHAQNMQLQEELVRHVIKTVIEKCSKELEILERDVEVLKKANAPFVKMTHRAAMEYVIKKGSKSSVEDDLSTEDEELLMEDFDVPVFIEKWPTKIKAFYMKRDPENPELVLGSDLMAPEGFGEIIGGSEREADHDELKKRMEDEDMPMEDYQWYLDCRKFGSVPHSGFGIGLERLVSWMAGVRHIRECIPFPRMIYRIKP